MKSRLVLVVVFGALWMGGLGYRLYEIQIVRHEEYAARARRQHRRIVEVDAPRGTIFDRKGRILAVSVAVDSAYANPAAIDDPEAAAGRIAEILGVERRKLATSLASERGFVWVQRKLEPEQSRALRALELPGIGFVRESKRYYPFGELAAQVLGFVGVDNNGLYGLEARYESVVRGQAARRSLLLDAKGTAALAPAGGRGEPTPGRDLHLTLDAAIQHIVERELAAALRSYGARRGSVVLLDPHDGAVLAMAASPGFDPNRFGAYPEARWRNSPVMDAYEPGSTFKVNTLAAALDANLIAPDDVIDCEMGAIEVADVRIRDHRPFGKLTVREILAHSSNVGAIKIALATGPERLWRQARAFGFGARTGIDLPAESAGLLRPLERWQAATPAYFAFGQGVAVTPLQLAVAFAAVADRGVLHQPYVVARIGGGDAAASSGPAADRLARRAVQASTAHLLERLLEAVVEEGGGFRAAIPGYRVAGKTGTSEKALPGGRGYAEGKRIASFAGFAPARDPAVVAVVVIDEPRTAVWGSEVAAPVFRAIVEKTLHYLGVPPEARPRDDLGTAPTVRRAAWPGPRGGREANVEGQAVAVARRPLGAGRIPDLYGLTARQALVQAAAVGLDVRLTGSGFVVGQEPAPGRRMEAGSTVRLWLRVGGGG